MALDAHETSKAKKAETKKKVSAHKFEKFEGTQDIVGVCSVTKGDGRGKEFTLNGINGSANCPYCGTTVPATEIGVRQSKARKKELAAVKKVAPTEAEQKKKRTGILGRLGL